MHLIDYFPCPLLSSAYLLIEAAIHGQATADVLLDGVVLDPRFLGGIANPALRNSRMQLDIAMQPFHLTKDGLVSNRAVTGERKEGRKWLLANNVRSFNYKLYASYTKWLVPA